eukprot:TRINITY_DN22_c0_g1_i1.p1 TRINITY_DN22_c0_g1~~TRINITY_DN22_c0_g1_i1.p1  ORF type:complete len:518 (-),score=147.17 TRINITY_DN22_c0_g1_i1:90-1643(-)
MLHRTKMISYESLCHRLKKINALENVSELLGWDQEVMMPKMGAAFRAEQRTVIASLIHSMRTDQELGKLIETCEVEVEKEHVFDEFQKANIRDARRMFARATRIPAELEEARGKLEAEGYEIWSHAKKKGDFSLFQPVLEKWINLLPRISRCIDEKSPPYEVALDMYERGMTLERLNEVFSSVKTVLVPLIHNVCKSCTPERKEILVKKYATGDFSSGQAELSRRISEKMGFDFDRGRIDTSLHPFTCTCSGRDDVRITSKYQDHEWIQGMMATLHETGHGLYEQGRSSEHSGLPVGEALSMGIHESQSLLWERHVGLSLSFWKFALPMVRNAFNWEEFDDTEKACKDVHRLVNWVERSFIRIEADELTYPMHVILRYEIGRDLFDGKIQVSDVPKVWNEKMKSYLGIEPRTDAEGALQDVHWGVGYFGYFPTYLLGAIAASQIFHAMEVDLGKEVLEESLSKGEFATIRKWLQSHIHEKGSLYPSMDELLKNATGEPLNPKYYTEYLTKKHSELFL